MSEEPQKRGVSVAFLTLLIPALYRRVDEWEAEQAQVDVLESMTICAPKTGAEYKITVVKTARPSEVEKP